VGQELLRRASKKVTMDVYAHSLTPAKGAASTQSCDDDSGKSQRTARVPRTPGDFGVSCLALACPTGI